MLNKSKVLKNMQAISHRAPIYKDAGFMFENIYEVTKAFSDRAGKEPYYIKEESTAEEPLSESFQHETEPGIYTRYGNPTVRDTEISLANLEAGKDDDEVWSILTSSGMSAIDLAISIFVCNGKEKIKIPRRILYFSDIYGGTKGYIKSVLKECRDFETDVFEFDEEEVFQLEDFKEKIYEFNPRIVLLETISNPLLIVPDLNKIVQIIKNYNDEQPSEEFKIKLVVDNTFATPLLSKPLNEGADLVIHSATKYLAGHGNLTAGVVCGKGKDLYKKASDYKTYVGCILSPDDAYLLQTYLMSFELRFRRQCENAFKLAQFLEKNKKIAHIRYPGLESHKTHQQAKSLFEKSCLVESTEHKQNIFGAMLIIDLKGHPDDKYPHKGDKDLNILRFEAAHRFVESIGKNDVCPVKCVISLGDINSTLISAPSVFVAQEPPFPGGMLRISIGCDPYEELQNSFEMALAQV